MIAAAAQPVTYGLDASMARFTLSQYHRMIDAGILTSEDRVELLEEYVVLKLPRNPPHDSTIQRMLKPLLRPIPTGWDLRIQLAVTLVDSEPEPDFAIVRGTARHYQHRHPGAADIGQLIEVADSSLLRDQRDKARIYAPAFQSTGSSTSLTAELKSMHSPPALPACRRMPRFKFTCPVS